MTNAVFCPSPRSSKWRFFFFFFFFLFSWFGWMSSAGTFCFLMFKDFQSGGRFSLSVS